MTDLYNERSGVLDGDDDAEVDLASYAYQIWKNATDADPTLKATIPELPPVVYATRPHPAAVDGPPGALVYTRTAEGTDALAWVDASGTSVTESQFTILRAAACAPDTPALARRPDHHELVAAGVHEIAREEVAVGGQLGRPSGVRNRVYQRLTRYADSVAGTLFETAELKRAVDEVFRHPLKPGATDAIGRQLKSGASDEQIADLVLGLRRGDDLCVVEDDSAPKAPHLICSLGLRAPSGEEAPTT